MKIIESTEQTLFPRTSTSSRPLRGMAAALALTIAVAACGGDSLDATETTETGSNEVPATSAAETTGAASSLFDSSQVHDISISYDQAEYEAMIETYADTGDKDWITGTVTIDGTELTEVGLRLKGNSSLRGLGGGEGREGGFGGGPGGSVSAEEPESLPWLVRLDKLVDGQQYEGYTSFVVRSNTSSTSLNEAVALELLDAAGLATQDATPVRFSVNDGEPVLRLVIENPDDTWEDANFSGDGVLYKAEASGDYTYRGEDPESYVDVFDQETGAVEDLSPLIGLLDFVNNSDDATFAAELGEHLDVDAFATYLAVQELIDNGDDIDGPGNNSYLRYDADADLFTVVAWDHNLAFGGFGGSGFPSGDGGFPGGGGRDGEPPPGGMPPGGEPPAGWEPPSDFQPPTGDGETPTGDWQPPEGFQDGGGRGRRGRSNPLVERFMADTDFAALYEAKLAELSEQLYESGTAAEILQRWSSVLTTHASDLVDAATVEQEAAAIAEHFAT